MTVLHRPGRKHQNADSLSRIPHELEVCNCYEAGKSLESLPCGGCRYCTRAHHHWKRLEKDVDDVIPLAVKKCVDVQVRVIAIDESSDQDIPWVMGYSIKEIQERQEKDHDIKPVLQWMKNDTEPTEAELFVQSKTTKFYWIIRSLFLLKKGLLFYKLILSNEGHIDLLTK